MKWIFMLLYAPLLLLYGLSSKTKRQAIIRDLYARKSYTRSGFSAVPDLAIELSSPYFRNLFYYRISSLAVKLCRLLYGGEKTFIIDIHTKLGSGVRLAHPYATILNAESIGDNLYVNHLVTVGEIKGRKPVIGNNVELHANCTVVGGITVGDNAVIGAGAVVVKDVPAFAVAVGNPARIVKVKNQ